MNYLTLDQLKHQLNMEQDFYEDDDYLTLLGSASEQVVDDHLDHTLQDIVIRNGGHLPENLRLAMLMYFAYSYSQRGDNPDLSLPKGFNLLLRPYIHFPIQ